MRRQSLLPILMAILTAFSTIIFPNRCLSFRSASSIAARSRAQHRAPSLRTYLLRASEPFGENYCPRRRSRPAACSFSALLSSSPRARLPPSENNYPAIASIGPNNNAQTIIYPEQQYTLYYDGRSRRRGTTATGGGAASSSGAVLYDSSGIEVWSSSHHYSEDDTITSSIYEASYRGLISGLQHAKSLGLQHIVITGSNELLHKQIEGFHRAKKPSLRQYHREVMSLKQDFTSFQMNFVDKTQNERARQLAQISLTDDHHFHPRDATTIEQNASGDARNREKKTTEEMEEDDKTSNFIDINLDSISDIMNGVNPDKPYILRFDGASSRGNPGGAAGSGMVLYDIGGDELWSGYQYLGDAKHTNNEAEYIGLITGLRVARILGVEHIIAQGDGPLILRQIEGTNKVNSAKLKPLYDRAMSLKKAFVSFHTSQIERSQNARANELAIEAMNTQGSSFEVHHMVGNRDATPSPRNEEEDDEDELKQYIATSLEDIDVNISEDITRKASISDDRSRKGKTLDPQQTYILCFDGGSRGNPGIAGAGMVLCDQVDGHEIWSGCQYIGGMSTNNEAEYTALITGLRIARSMGVENILVQGDSQLILRQIDGVYRVKSEKLRSYYEEAMSLKREFTSFQTNHIERARNVRADELANEAMNNKSSRGIDVPH